jgi:hypothetical protein
MQAGHRGGFRHLRVRRGGRCPPPQIQEIEIGALHNLHETGEGINISENMALEGRHNLCGCSWKGAMVVVVFEFET